MPFQSQIETDDYNQQFTRVRRGSIRSHSSHTFRFGENSLNIPIVIDQSIEFEECPHKPLDERHSTLQLSVTRNYITYDNNEQIVRYASTSSSNFYNLSSELYRSEEFLSDLWLKAEDPCRTGRSQCGQHSSCVVEGLNFKCVCDRGYETNFREDAIESQNTLNVANCVGELSDVSFSSSSFVPRF